MSRRTWPLVLLAATAACATGPSREPAPAVAPAIPPPSSRDTPAAAAGADEAPLDHDVDRGRGVALEDEGAGLLERGDAEGALERFTASCRLRVRCSHARVGAALAVRALGDTARAQRLLDRALALAEAAEGDGAGVRVELAPGLRVPGHPIASPVGSRWAYLSGGRASLVDGTTLRELARVEATAPPAVPEPPHVPGAPWVCGVGCVYACAGGVFSADARLLVWAHDGSYVSLWDTEDPAGPVALAGDPAVSPVEVKLSPDGRLVAAGVKSGVALWDVATRAPLRVVPGGPRFAFSADGARVTTGEGVFDVATGHRLVRSSLATGETAIAVAPDGAWVLARSEAQAPRARVHFLTEPRRVPVELPDAGWVGRSVASPDGTRLVTARGDGVVRLWEVASGREVERWESGVGTEEIAWRPDGRTVVSWGSGARHRLQLWDTERQLEIGDLKVGPSSPRGFIADAAFSTDGRRVLTVPQGGGHDLGVWDVATGEALAEVRGDASGGAVPDAVPAERSLACRVGAERYPFALCASRFSAAEVLEALRTAARPSSAPAVAAPPRPLFAAGTHTLVGGMSAEVFEDGRVEGGSSGRSLEGLAPPGCHARLTPAQISSYQRRLGACCGMGVRSLGRSELGVDQRTVTVTLGARTCSTVEGERVWHGNAAARACVEAVTAFLDGVCGGGGE